MTDAAESGNGVNGSGAGEHGVSGSIPPATESSLSLSAAQQIYLSAARSLLVQRLEIAGRLGLDQFGGQRRIYDALGYPAPGTLTFADYRERFERGGIAKRILRAAPRAMGWPGMQLVERPVATHLSERKKARKTGEIDKSGYTDFENEWDKLTTRLSVGSILERADIIAGLGEYSAVYVGVKESGASNPSFLETPLPRLRSSDDIVYLRVLSQENCWITEYVGDISSDRLDDPRYGLPKFYNIRLAGGNNSTSGRRSIGSDQGGANITERKVHASRIIHITQNPLYDEVFSRPELEAIWNYLCNLDKLAGGGSEAFYRDAVQRVLFDIDKDIDLAALNAVDPKTGKTMKEIFSESLEEMMHDLKQHMIGRGVTPKPFGGTPKDFSTSGKFILTLIACTVEQPQRILYGSEAGHLASTQDQENANSYVFARRNEFGNRTARLFADRLISVNALPKPTKYEVWWPNDNESTDKEKGQIVGTLALANLHQHQADGTIIMTCDEMRDEYFDLDPLEIAPEDIAGKDETTVNDANGENVAGGGGDPATTKEATDPNAS